MASNEESRWRRYFELAGPLSTVCIVLALLGVVVVSYRRSHPEVSVPAGNRESYARVGILVDGTRSMQPQTYPLMKSVVRQKILPALGSNDLAVAYDVQPGFTTQGNTVFGLEEDEQLPQDPPARREEILEILAGAAAHHGGSTPSDALYSLLGEVARRRAREVQIRDAWGRRLVQRPEPKVRGSDICHPLEDLGSFLREGDADDERWLFVLSDLQHTGPPCHPDSPYPNARIFAILPADPQAPSWPELMRRWQAFFGGQTIRRLTIGAALTGPPLLPPNPTAGLEPGEVGTWWGCAQAMILRSLLVAAGSGLAAAAIVTLAVRRQ